jgi:hypothetical protein
MVQGLLEDKWIPLDFNSGRRHECRKYVFPCKKGCGALIYFDRKQKSTSEKLIPMEVATQKNHACSSTYAYSKIRRHGFFYTAWNEL